MNPIASLSGSMPILSGRMQMSMAMLQQALQQQQAVSQILTRGSLPAGLGQAIDLSV